jgi:hypothetical protein
MASKAGEARLRTLHQHFRPQPAGMLATSAPVLSPAGAAHPGRRTAAQPALLGDAAMAGFVTEGYHMMHPELPAGYHEMIREKFDVGGIGGNNMVAQVPELMTLFDNPEINGALQSVLGSDYHLHHHRAAHIKRGVETTNGQRHHKDSVGNSRVCVDSKRRHHRTRWCMLLYFPQETPVELGPTAIVPQSQYMLRYDMRPHPGRLGYDGPDDVELEEELPCAGPAGTCCLIHYDMLHRAMASRLDQTRHMLKFIICRMSEPTAPSWDHTPGKWDAWQASDHPQAQVHAAIWHWHLGSHNDMLCRGSPLGSPAATAATVEQLAARLRSANEETAVDAAYALGGRGGPESAAALVAALAEATPAQKDWSGNGNGGTDTATSAGYGLVNTRDGCAVAEILELLASGPPVALKARAIDALADMGLPAAPALPQLLDALDDEAWDVRRRAAEGLGLVGQVGGTGDMGLADVWPDHTD